MLKLGRSHRLARVLGAVGCWCVMLAAPAAWSQATEFVLEQGGNVLALQPYGPNLVRVTMSTSRAEALARPGYGIIAAPMMAGWSHEHESSAVPSGPGVDVYRSSGLVVRVSPIAESAAEKLQPMPLDALNLQLRDHYFGMPPDPHAAREQEVRVETAQGRTLLTMRSWQMIPNTGEEGSRVKATFDSPQNEHYYGLGQQQMGFLDLRDHHLECWHNYDAPGGETLGVPFMVSSRGYGLVWDNPSKTTVDLGLNQQNVFSSEVGDRVSFFVIAGASSDQIYEGYRQLTGVTHLLPKPVYGYIQSKAIYPTQAQLLAVAQGYRERHDPLDVLVVDFLNMTRQGQLDLDPARWPDPAAMNDQLHAMGIRTLLSVWPHFAQGTQFYDMLRSKGWLVHTADGTPDGGQYKDVIGPNIDTTNPAAARWFWEQIRDRYIKPDHFDYVWLDETEPDIDPEKDEFFIGSGARYYNVYPLFHTASVYEGFRRDFGDSRRVMILARAAYLGAQRNGTVFWSSDIHATWDMLKRSIPTGLDMTATGLPYWDTDIAGFFSPQLPADYKPAHPPLVDPSDALANVGRYTDYPELFVRWFEWGVFQPVMRAHGEREHNEVWSYGRQAEGILEKYLRMRYQLLPYTYSAAYQTYETGAPYMRALFMDFPGDPRVADLPDEYMYGPALLVAPISDQGATSRQVYLPAGTDWYNYWTNERIHGGRTITAAAPIDTIPLFVRAGSILPLGSAIESTATPQSIASVRVYPGADGAFTLFHDDGTTYAYEHGGGRKTVLHWDDAQQKFTHTGDAAWSSPDNTIVTVVGAGRP